MDTVQIQIHKGEAAGPGNQLCAGINLCGNSFSVIAFKASFSLLIVLPGTEIYRQLVEAGEVDPARVASFYYHVGYVPKGMTAQELKRLQLRAFFEFYARPRILWRLLGEIQSWTQVRILLGKVWNLIRGG